MNLTGIMMKDHAQYYFDKARELEERSKKLMNDYSKLSTQCETYRTGFIQQTLRGDEYQAKCEELESKVQRLEKALEKKINQVNELTRQNEYMDEKIKTAEEICLRGE